MRHLLAELEQILGRDGRPPSRIEREAGIGKDTFTRWAKLRVTGGNGPSLALFEAVLEVLGYELRIVKRGKGNVDQTTS
jgi:hypothetical protein